MYSDAVKALAHEYAFLPSDISVVKTRNGVSILKWPVDTKPSQADVAAACLAYAKYKKTSEIKSLRDADFDAGFDADATGSVYHYDSDTTALARIANAIGTAVDSGIPDIGWGCKDAAGNAVKVTHTIDQLKAVRLAGLLAIEAIHAHYYEVLGSIEAATTIQEVEAISWGA